MDLQLAMIASHWHVMRNRTEKEISAPVREVDLLKVGQARVALERHSQRFRANITDRVDRDTVGAWT
jgi:hypothetical protein